MPDQPNMNSIDALKWPAFEGADLSPVSLLVLLCGLIVIWVLARPRNNESQHNSLILFLAQISRQWRSLFIVIVGILYIVSSTYLDQVSDLDQAKNLFYLYSFSALCWLVFLGIHFALYDMLAVLLRKAGLNIRTDYVSINLALSFFIGSRILVLFLWAFSFLGLENSIHGLLAATYLWLIYRTTFAETIFGSFTRSQADTSHQAVRWRIANILPAFSLVLPALYCLLIISYLPLTSWDNYTHWLVLPQEMIAQNKYLFDYAVSASVAPSYPPQQVTDFVILLRLWGDTNLSEIIIAFHNPLLLFLGMWIIIEIYGHNLTHIGKALFALTLAAVVFSLPSEYWSTAYGDARSAVCLLLMAVGLAVYRKPNKNPDLFLLLVIMSCAFTLKPYLAIFAFLSIPILLFSGTGVKNTLIYGIGLLGFAAFEVFVYNLASPASLLIADSVNVSRLFEWRFSEFLIGLNFTQHGLILLIVSALLGLTVISLAFASKLSANTRDTIIFSGLTILGLVTILCLVIWTNRSYGTSLERYLLNLILLVVLSLTALSTSISQTHIRHIVTYVATISLAFGLFLVSDDSSFYSSSEWYRIRLSDLQPFPEQNSDKFDFVRLLQEEDKTLNGRHAVIIHPYESQSEQPFFNYGLVRLTDSFYSPTATWGVGPIQPLLEITDPKAVAPWIDEQNVRYFYIRENTQILGINISPRLYTSEELLSLIVKT